METAPLSTADYLATRLQIAEHEIELLKKQKELKDVAYEQYRDLVEEEIGDLKKQIESANYKLMMAETEKKVIKNMGDNMLKKASEENESIKESWQNAETAYGDVLAENAGLREELEAAKKDNEDHLRTINTLSDHVAELKLQKEAVEAELGKVYIELLNLKLEKATKLLSK